MGLTFVDRNTGETITFAEEVTLLDATPLLPAGGPVLLKERTVSIGISNRMDAREFYKLRGMEITNNWIKMHGGVLIRKGPRRRKKK